MNLLLLVFEFRPFVSLVINFLAVGHFVVIGVVTVNIWATSGVVAVDLLVLGVIAVNFG